jgi:hypothetical protein
MSVLGISGRMPKPDVAAARSGSIRVEQEQRQRFHLAMMKSSWARMRGSTAIHTAKNTPIRLD